MGAEELPVEEPARRFIDGFNRRDADALVAVCHPQLEFLPTILVGQRAVCHGHEGLRRWVEDLRASGARPSSTDRRAAAAQPTKMSLPSGCRPQRRQRAGSRSTT